VETESFQVCDSTETGTAGKIGNAVWKSFFGYRKHTQRAGCLQRPTYCCARLL